MNPIVAEMLKTLLQIRREMPDFQSKDVERLMTKLITFAETDFDSAREKMSKLTAK